MFFLSGFAGLTYEIVWIRILSSIFGKTVLAVTIVTSVYMAGLGLGSIYWGKKADACKNSLALFAVLQLYTGIASLAILFIFFKLPVLYASIMQIMHLPLEASSAVIFFVSFILLFVPTFLMGGTFPVISREYVKSASAIGKGTGTLYAFNTFGGILGVCAAGYFLIGAVGQTATQGIAIVINLLVGAAACHISKKSPLAKEPPGRNDGIESGAPPAGPKALPVRGIFMVAAISGFCGLALEILATRVLGIFLINSSYSFTGILLVFLTGIGTGSYCYAKALDTKNRRLLLGLLLLLAAGYWIAVVAAYLNDIPLLLHPVKQRLYGIPALYYMVPGIMLSAILLFIPAFCMGMLFPLLCGMLSAGTATIGHAVGKLYFVNTLGCIAGPPAACFLLIPLAGVSKALLITALLLLLPVLVLLRSAVRWKAPSRYLVAAALLLCAGAPFAYRAVGQSVILPPSLFRTNQRNDTLLFYRETVEGTVLVNQDRNTGIRYLYVNNTAVVGVTYDAIKVVKMLAHLPFIASPESKKILIIGFGMGITAAECAKHNVERIECVEICPGIKSAAPYFRHINGNVIHDPRVHFVGADGRNFLLLSDEKYDIISCDPSHPTLGSGNLYSREYFTLCRNHLSEKGIVSQYLPMHLIAPHEFQSIVKTFFRVFPHATLWIGQSHCILLGALQPTRFDFGLLQQTLAALNDDIVGDPYNIAASLLLDAGAVERFTSAVDVYSDETPFLDYHSVQGIREENWQINIQGLMKHQIDAQTYFYNIENRETLLRYVLGQELFLNALIKKNRGYRSIEDVATVVEMLKRAAHVNPENNEILMHLEHEMQLLKE